jgi:hypothetical protein
MQNSEGGTLHYAAIEMMKQGGGLTISAVLGYLYYLQKNSYAFWV